MITVISYPNNEINYSIAEPVSTNSEEIVQLINVNIADTTTDEYIEITFNGEVIELVIQDECRYTPIDIYFLNKEGEQQIITFFKAKTDTLGVTKETYESNSGQPSDGNHQYVDYNIQGRTNFKVNSGFVNESMNDSFKQLLLSSKVYVYNNGFVPLNVTKTSLEYKTRQKDRLINYEIDFSYSYNEINTL
ncbi:hypothetical protein [uncultured Lutibacter sp.]|uniref:hypothetical protein n=1 Tax=uncultured Lutibacter sp. TaxID=437739 RepID=UPI0026239B29|nr:hypothetical protein [uncultured Lutibacter sp.]